MGCFHFAVKRKPPFKFKGLEYIKNIETSLRSIPNIDNIEIYFDEDFRKLSLDVRGKILNLEDGEWSFPDVTFGVIKFEVYIPFRIQAKLSREKEIYLTTFTEKFKVSVYQTYHLPVAFVETVNPSQECDPSSAVQIIREFLRQEFKNLKPGIIQFECLGPSPFHANFFIKNEVIEESNKANWRFKTKYLIGGGYDNIEFYFNQEVFNNPEKAKEGLIEELTYEAGFFYYIQSLHVQKMHSWREIEKILDRLIYIHGKKLTKKGLRDFFIFPHLISKAFMSIVEFKVSEFSCSDSIRNDYNDVYSHQEEEYLKSYIDEQIKKDYSYPTEDMHKLIDFLEGRRTKTIEYFIALLSAILGGAIGSILTILLSKTY